MCVCVSFSYLKEKSIRHLFDLFLKFKKLQILNGFVFFRDIIDPRHTGKLLLVCLVCVCVEIRERERKQYQQKI